MHSIIEMLILSAAAAFVNTAEIESQYESAAKYSPATSDSVFAINNMMSFLSDIVSEPG